MNQKPRTESQNHPHQIMGMAANTPEPAAPVNRKHLYAALIYYMGGMLVFYAAADFDKVGWVKAWWIWCMTKETVFVAALYLILKPYRRVIYPVLYFSVIRSVWEIVAQLWDQDINNTHIINALFYILCMITIGRLAKDLKNQWAK